MVIYKGLRLRMPSEFSATTMKAKRQCYNCKGKTVSHLEFYILAELWIKCVQRIKVSLDI